MNAMQARGASSHTPHPLPACLRLQVAALDDLVAESAGGVVREALASGLMALVGVEMQVSRRC